MTQKIPSKRRIALRTALVLLVALSAVPAVAAAGRAHIVHGMGLSDVDLRLPELIELTARVQNGGHLTPRQHLDVLTAERAR